MGRVGFQNLMVPVDTESSELGTRCGKGYVGCRGRAPKCKLEEGATISKTPLLGSKKT